jgi:hypothetical protein
MSINSNLLVSIYKSCKEINDIKYFSNLYKFDLEILEDDLFEFRSIITIIFNENTKDRAITLVKILKNLASIEYTTNDKFILKLIEPINNILVYKKLTLTIFDKFEKIEEIKEFANIYNFDLQILNMVDNLNLYKTNIKIFYTNKKEGLHIVNEFTKLNFACLSNDTMKDRFIMKLII